MNGAQGKPWILAGQHLHVFAPVVAMRAWQDIQLRIGTRREGPPRTDGEDHQPSLSRVNSPRNARKRALELRRVPVVVGDGHMLLQLVQRCERLGARGSPYQFPDRFFRDLALEAMRSVREQRHRQQPL